LRRGIASIYVCVRHSISTVVLEGRSVLIVYLETSRVRSIAFVVVVIITAAFLPARRSVSIWRPGS
jgi:hypothetical protein